MAINSQTPKAERELPDYYDKFVERFKPKHTTDDCMTHDAVYAAVRDWTVEKYGISPDVRIIRPFWPGADYQKADYTGDCVVIDNPPFSILSQIVRWYMARGIRFMLFAPTLQLFSIAKGEASYIVTTADITYANGAKIPTSLITNLTDKKICVYSDLSRRMELADKQGYAVPKGKPNAYQVPDNVVTAAKLQRYARHMNLEIDAKDTYPVSKLDNMPKALFGKGFLLSDKAAAERMAAERMAAERMAAERAAAERAAAERAAAEVIQLSPRELDIIARLG